MSTHVSTFACKPDLMGAKGSIRTKSTNRKMQFKPIQNGHCNKKLYAHKRAD